MPAIFVSCPLREVLLHIFTVAVTSPCVCRPLLMHASVLPSPCHWQFDHFMENFTEESSSGFFRETAARWGKWVDEHQQPLSIARIACSLFYRGKWAGSRTASELSCSCCFPTNTRGCSRLSLRKRFAMSSQRTSCRLPQQIKTIG